MPWPGEDGRSVRRCGFSRCFREDFCCCGTEPSSFGRVLLGPAKKIFERGQRFDNEEYLIGKQSSRQLDQRRVDREQRTAQAGVSKRQRERSGNAAHLADAKAGLLEQSPERRER